MSSLSPAEGQQAGEVIRHVILRAHVGVCLVVCHSVAVQLDAPALNPAPTYLSLCTIVPYIKMQDMCHKLHFLHNPNACADICAPIVTRKLLILNQCMPETQVSCETTTLCFLSFKNTRSRPGFKPTKTDESVHCLSGCRRALLLLLLLVLFCWKHAACVAGPFKFQRASRLSRLARCDS